MKREVSCGGFCTDTFNESIHLVFGAMHMHYLGHSPPTSTPHRIEHSLTEVFFPAGTGGYSELWRDGEKVRNIMVQDFYDYNAPHFEVYEAVHLRNHVEIA